MTSVGGRLPDFLIVGAMKAGTTSLATWLRAHPQVFLPADKELHFFEHHWGRGADWYRAQFAHAPPGVVAGEASPAYMVHRVYIDRMAAVVPNARLIALLRNPVDRAWSQYRHMVARGERRSFDELLEWELSAGPSGWSVSGMCLARGRYIDQLGHLEARFGRGRLHVELFDDLVGQPEELFASVCRFLGIDESVRPGILGRVMDPVALLGPRLATDDHRGLLDLSLVNTPGAETRPRPDPMPPVMRVKLVDYFRPYNEALSEWLEVDLSAWDA